jgi:hypothetical protein
MASAASLLLISCSVFEGPDSLVGEARSPDGARVARLWCEDFCDVPSSARLTISATSRSLQLEREHADEWPEGEMPEDDAVIRVFRDEGSASLTLRWSDASTLVVGGHCLTDGNFKRLAGTSFEGIQVRFQDMARSGECELAHG